MTDFQIMKGPLKGRAQALMRERFAALVLSSGCDDGIYTYFSGEPSTRRGASIYRVRSDGRSAPERLIAASSLSSVSVSSKADLLVFTDIKSTGHCVKAAKKDGSSVRIISSEAAEQLRIRDGDASLLLLRDPMSDGHYKLDEADLRTWKVKKRISLKLDSE